MSVFRLFGSGTAVAPSAEKIIQLHEYSLIIVIICIIVIAIIISSTP